MELAHGVFQYFGDIGVELENFGAFLDLFFDDFEPIDL